MTIKPHAPATERNAAAILDVLRIEFSKASSVLEIGSGTGQHAVTFAAALDHLTWQTSDRDENRDGINAWVADSGLDNILQPLSLDVLRVETLPDHYDAVFSANTAHIMSSAAVAKMFALVAAALDETGRFCLYGPFREGGEFNTASNAEFHRSLRQRDPDMGIRHIEDLDRHAEAGSMQRLRQYAMPANNLLVVWQKVTRGAANGDT